MATMRSEKLWRRIPKEMVDVAIMVIFDEVAKELMICVAERVPGWRWRRAEARDT
jgi:hypothetical protein